MTLNIKVIRNIILFVGIGSAILGFWIFPLFNLTDYLMLERLRTYARLVGVLGSFLGLIFLFLPDFILMKNGRVSLKND